MTKPLKILGRIALTGATICGIGFAFVALNPSEKDGAPSLEVKESNADIFAMSFAERTSTQKFQAALENLGHETPRVYDLNGNTVMFSVNQKRGSIDDIVGEYMRAFAEEGVNPEIIDPQTENGTAAHKRAIEAGVNGGVLPWVVNDDYMSMGGAVMDVASANDDDLAERVDGQSKEFEELLDRLEHGYRSCGGDGLALQQALKNPRQARTMGHAMKVEKTMTTLCEGKARPGGMCDTMVYRQKQNENRYNALVQVIEDQELKECGPVQNAITAFAGMRYDDFTSRVKAFRSIEAWHNKKTNMTKITATWSDEDFDMKKTQPSRYGGPIKTEAAQKVPLCPGCRRTWAFQGTGVERPFTSNMIISPNDPVRTANFYVREMSKDGWQIPDADLVVDEMERMDGRQDPNNQWVRFRRGNENMALHFTKDEEGRTRVRATTAP